MSCVPFTGLAQFCRPPAARGHAWRGVTRKELREEGREERVRLLQLERVERPTPSSSVPTPRGKPSRGEAWRSRGKSWSGGGDG